MNLLLDTHAFVWWRDSPENLSQPAFDAISAPGNDIFLTVVSVWELQIKIGLNKLELKGSLEEAVRVELTQNGFNLLPLALEHIYNLKSIGFPHKDPFDRMIISQAIVEDMTILTADPKFSEYPVKLLW